MSKGVVPLSTLIRFSPRHVLHLGLEWGSKETPKKCPTSDNAIDVRLPQSAEIEPQQLNPTGFMTAVTGDGIWNHRSKIDAVMTGEKSAVRTPTSHQGNARRVGQ
ncbi:hypothetical protein EVAR_63734_1 [Eumeta japonica]|uniref:Uncharacterized protein n=1 Tax=Eumeta variegata TaxID=151549 RepID=A0A4C1ZIJ7_EUMVA|nr:hypothetical protein EVAR_63734_1 [Eumeta japonica]